MLSLTKRLSALALLTVLSLHEAQAQDLNGVLKKIKDMGVITMGYHEGAIPLSYLDENQKPVGYALDLCALAAEKIKKTLGLSELKVDYQPVSSETAAAAVRDGKVDMVCGAMSETSALQEQAALSIPVFVSELRWIAPRKLRVETEGSRRRRAEAKSVSTADDLRDKTVVLPQGSPAAQLVLTLSSDRSLGLSILQGKDYAESFRLVESGRASAVLGDDIILMGLKANAKNPDAYGFLDDSYPGATYGLPLRKDDQAFKDVVDAALRDAVASGEFQKIYSRWFGSPIPVKNVNLAYPMPEKLKQVLKQSTASKN